MKQLFALYLFLGKSFGKSQTCSNCFKKISYDNNLSPPSFHKLVMEWYQGRGQPSHLKAVADCAQGSLGYVPGTHGAGLQGGIPTGSGHHRVRCHHHKGQSFITHLEKKTRPSKKQMTNLSWEAAESRSRSVPCTLLKVMLGELF